MRYLPDTGTRVAAHTPDHLNRAIAAQIERNVRFFAEHPDRIDQRLRELDAEWDTERVLEANAATLAFTGTVLAAVSDRRWLALPAVVTAFLLQHAVQGWCPPIPVIRRLGVRTTREIDRERVALKALRGDFDAMERADGAAHARAVAALRAAEA
ncbi:hypothetical protein [Falsiroseomonas sp.]|uniref:hypothetical protein n=1 Tax=Falsiroseomonas sp. TaxID=2870721 RepID=UPI0035687060